MHCGQMMDCVLLGQGEAWAFSGLSDDRRAWRAASGNFSHTERDVGHQLGPGPFIQLGDQCRFQVGELLKPDRIAHEQVQFLKSDVRRPSMGGDRFSGKFGPLVLKPQLEEMGLKAEPLGQAGENRAERIQRTLRAHAGIIAKSRRKI